MVAMPTGLTARTVHFADSTTISYPTTGTGPGVLVVPARSTTPPTTPRWPARSRPTSPCTSCSGAGSGPQGHEHGIATECADLCAARAATGARYFFGHSYGGLIALEAARRDPDITKLALCEPRVSVQGLIPMDWIPQYRQFLAQGRPIGAFATFAIGTGPAAARRNPRWLMSAVLRLVFRGERRAKIFQLLEANLHEHEEIGRLDDSYPNYREVSADVLLMAGSKSGLPYVAPAFDRLTEVLPSARVHTFPKLDHIGPHEEAPAEVAEAVTTFLLS